MANFVSYFAIEADDLERAQAFYANVFGWRFEQWGPPGFYRVFTGPKSDPCVTEGALERRSRPLPEGITSAYRCTISVPALGETLRRLERFGGALKSPEVELPGIGKVVRFIDSENNLVCAMEYDAADRRSAIAR